MKTLIIFDSFFGNTKQIALAIAKGLPNKDNIQIVKIKDVNLDMLKDLNLLIIGSPTRAFRASPDITKFINSIPADGLKEVGFTTFDTRISIEDIKSKGLSFLVNIFGYAAKPISDILKKKGGTLIAPPEGFLVADKEGPLKEGEAERAEKWAEFLK